MGTNYPLVAPSLQFDPNWMDHCRWRPQEPRLQGFRDFLVQERFPAGIVHYLLSIYSVLFLTLYELLRIIC